MRKTIFTCLVAFMGLLAFSTAQAITYTDYDPDTHKGILCVGIDDYMDATQLDTLDAVGLPVTFFIYEEEAEANANRRRDTNRAINSGYDIQAHTTSVGIDTLTTAELHTMFSEAKEYVTSKRRMRTDWSAEPVAFTYFGNNWTTESQEIGKTYFDLIRLRPNSSDATPVKAYPDEPDASPTWSSGRSLPLVQTDLSRVIYTASTAICDSCGTATASTDTTGIGEFLTDIVTNRTLVITSLHRENYDISNHQIATLLREANSRGDIWITDISHLWAELGSSHDTDSWGVVYADAQGDSAGLGTATDPVALEWALSHTWGQAIQLANETYDFTDMFGVDAAYDLILKNSMTIRGPATITITKGGTNTSDETAVSFDASPVGGTFTDTYQIRLVNCTIDVGSGDSASESGIYIADRHASVDSCTINQGSGIGIRVSGSAARAPRITNNTFIQDTGTLAGRGAVGKYSSGGDSLVFIANKVVTESDSNQYSHVGLIYSEVAIDADSILNNEWFNCSQAKNNYAFMTTTAEYGAVFGGNYIASPDTTGIIYLDSAAKNATIALDSLSDASGLAKNWVTLDSTRGQLNDTLRFGGYQLSGWSTGANHASIGPVQYTANPFVGSKLPFSRQSYAMLEGPWDLLQLIDNGVLSASDSLDTETWYPIIIGETPQEQAQYQLFIDAYNAWPEANRQKIRWSVE